MSTPYVGFGNGTLFAQPRLAVGDTITCPHCKGEHTVEGSREKGVESSLLLLYKCGGKLYLAGIFGKSTMKAKPDCSGEL